MLPESKSAQSSYVEMRDCRSRWRKMQLRGVCGDLDAFTATVQEDLAVDAEMPYLREVVDFAESEGMLTAGMREAANNAIAWGSILRRLALESVLAAGKVTQ